MLPSTALVPYTYLYPIMGPYVRSEDAPAGLGKCKGDPDFPFPYKGAQL